MKGSILFSALAMLVLSACNAPQQNANATEQTRRAETMQPNARWYNFDQVRAGAAVFTANCAECHGQNGQGATNWRQIGADGKYPAPPLNGSGHAWHHPLNMLFHVVKNGSPGGQGNMPAWADKLSDDEIIAAIAWFQSRWPEEVYQAWYNKELQMQAGN